MRKHRYALIASPFLVAGITAASLNGIAASTPKEQHARWTSSYIPASPKDHEQITRARYRLTTFAQAVNAWHAIQRAGAIYAAAETQYQEQQARERAASSSTASSGGSSPTTTTTIAPGASATPSSNAAIWACIISNESGGNPTIYNASGSGASGLYQFEPGTWGGYGGYANAADAPAWMQTQRAEQVQAEDGWSPWVGDGCTPLG